MKRTIFFLCILTSLFTAAQDYRGKKVIADQQLKPPPDTTFSKSGWSGKINKPWWGNDTVWIPPIEAIFSNIIEGDAAKLHADGTLYNDHIANQCVTRVVTGGAVTRIGLTHNFYVAQAIYFIGCTQFIWPGGYVTITDVVSNSKFSQIILSNTGASVVEGDEAADPVAQSIDLDSQILLATILVNSDNSIDITQSIIYDENTESTFATSGTITANPASSGNAAPESAGSLKIAVTAATNNAYFQLTMPDTLSIRAYINLSLYVQNVNALNANSNWSIQLYLGNTAISQEILFTGEGYSRAAGASYQQLVIPTAHFTTGTAGIKFNRVRIRRKGTGGTISARFDLIYVDHGNGMIVPDDGSSITSIYTKTDSLCYTRKNGTGGCLFISSGGGGSGLLPTTGTGAATGPVTGQLNNNKLRIDSGTIEFNHQDSIGAIVNYKWDASLGAEWASSGTAGSNTTGGFAINGTNSLTWSELTGVSNWSFTDTVVTAAKSSTTQKISYQLLPAFADVQFTRWLEFKLEDTAGYINYYKNSGGSVVYTSRGLYQLVWSSGDTLILSASFRQGNIYATLTNKANGSASTLEVLHPLENPGFWNIGNVASVVIKQIGNFKHVKHFVFNSDETYRPDFAFLGNSIEQGSGVSDLSRSWVVKLFEKYSDSYIFFGGSSERSNDGVTRLKELFNVIKPKYAGWFYGVNDPGASITAANYATYLNRFLDSAALHPETIPFVGTTTPQVTDRTAYYDSAVAICTRRNVLLIDFFTYLKAGSGGTNRNTIYDADGVHFNDYGDQVMANIAEFKLAGAGYLSKRQSIKFNNLTIASNVDYTLGVKNGNLVKQIVGAGGGFIKNINYLNSDGSANTAQDASIYLSANKNIVVTGDGVFFFGGSLTNPYVQFNKNGDHYFIAQLATFQNFSANPGGVTAFSNNYTLEQATHYWLPNGQAFRVDKYGVGANIFEGAYAGSATRYAIDTAGRVFIFNNNVPSTTISGGIIYANGGELFARDASGNNTGFSPHNRGLLPYKVKPLGWTYNSTNDKYGQITVDMLKAMEAIEYLSKEVERLKLKVEGKSKAPVKIIYKKLNK